MNHSLLFEKQIKRRMVKSLIEAIIISERLLGDEEFPRLLVVYLLNYNLLE